MLVNVHGNVDRSARNLKDTINEAKYRFLYLLGEVFIKAMNGLVMTFEEDKRFLWV